MFFKTVGVAAACAAFSAVSLPAQVPPESMDAAGFIRTPPAPRTPRIVGPSVYGERPGHPFFYHLPVTGDRPMTVTATATELPAGLSLDASNGNVTGTASGTGRYRVTFTARNALGSFQRPIILVIGPTLCLTPPMGWNSWNFFGPNIDRDKIRGAADAMVKTGLIDHGWTYVNMDDRWQGERDAAGRIQTSAAIGDMKTLTDYIHGLGLKAGIYSSPGPQTCAGGLGSFQHEDEDARSYADWGIDYLKYDWCSYEQNAIPWRAEAFAQALPADAAAIHQLLAQLQDTEAQHDQVPGNDAAADTKRRLLQAHRGQLNARLDLLYAHAGPARQAAINLAAFQAPYRTMRASLDKVNRDIAYSLCQYGMGDVQRWGAEVGGNLWRVTYDIKPDWPSLEAHAFRILPADGARYANPGHWNDPDMLEVGNGDLTPDENYLHMTAWCMLAAPLLIGCDLTHMSPFTVSLFSNDEVLAVDQDSLGKQGGRIAQSGMTEVWAKPLDDGSLAVAFFNRGPAPADVTAKWTDLNLMGSQGVRDLWRQKDLGAVNDHYTVNVASHGAELFKVSPLLK